jgi:hypothetical protein
VALDFGGCTPARKPPDGNRSRLFLGNDLQGAFECYPYHPRPRSDGATLKATADGMEDAASLSIGVTVRREGAGLQQVQLPPGNCFAPSDGNRSRLFLGKEQHSVLGISLRPAGRHQPRCRGAIER